jgi:hypothetical protein
METQKGASRPLMSAAKTRPEEPSARPDGSGTFPRTIAPLVPLSRSVSATLVESASGRRRDVQVVSLGLVGAEVSADIEGIAAGSLCALELVDQGTDIALPCEVQEIGDGQLRIEFGRMRPHASVWITRLLARG